MRAKFLVVFILCLPMPLKASDYTIPLDEIHLDKYEEITGSLIKTSGLILVLKDKIYLQSETYSNRRGIITLSWLIDEQISWLFFPRINGLTVEVEGFLNWAGHHTSLSAPIITKIGELNMSDVDILINDPVNYPYNWVRITGQLNLETPTQSARLLVIDGKNKGKQIVLPGFNIHINDPLSKIYQNQSTVILEGLWTPASSDSDYVAILRHSIPIERVKSQNIRLLEVIQKIGHGDVIWNLPFGEFTSQDLEKLREP